MELAQSGIGVNSVNSSAIVTAKRWVFSFGIPTWPARLK